MNTRNFIINLDQNVIDEITTLYTIVPPHLFDEVPLFIKSIYDDLMQFLVARVVEWAMTYDVVTWFTNVGYEGVYDYLDSGLCEFNEEDAEDLIYYITNTHYEDQSYFYRLITDSFDFSELDDDNAATLATDAITQVIYQMIPPMGAMEPLFEELKNSISNDIKKRFEGAMASIDFSNRCIVLIIDEVDLINNVVGGN